MHGRLLVAAALVMVVTASSVHGQTAPRRPQPTARRPAPVAARPVPPPAERLRIVFDGGAQLATSSFGQDFTLMENVEQMPVTTDLKLGLSGFVDGGALVRVGSKVSIGAVGFYSTGSANGTVDAQVPHPFYFDQPRDVSGDVSALPRRETGAHVMLAYPVSVSSTHEITVFGGPSYFHVQQELITDVNYSDAYPYDTATFVSAPATLASNDGFGFNAGAEITWRIARAVRAGALVRYSLANVALTAANGNTSEIHAGGLQVGAGLRVIVFKKAAPPRRPPPPPAPRRR